MSSINIDKKTTFAAKSTVLDVVIRSMKKKGIAVFLRSKTGKAKAVLGCRKLFAADKLDEAEAAYKELVAETTAKGWPLSAKGEQTKVKSAGSFSEIPAPPADESDEPGTEEPAGTEEPTPEPEPAKGKGNGSKGKGK